MRRSPRRSPAPWPPGRLRAEAESKAWMPAPALLLTGGGTARIVFYTTDIGWPKHETGRVRTVAALLSVVYLSTSAEG